MQCELAKTRMGWSCSPLPLPFASISRINQTPRRMMIRSRTEGKPFRATHTAGGLHRPERPSRRSADYHPTIWDHHLIESLRSPYTGEVFDRRLEESMLEVRASLEACEEPVARLRLIDSMRRLGVAYHFEEEIGEALERAHADAFKPSDGIYETALCFRLLRQHGRDVSSDVFNRFRDGKKGFKECLVRDVKGLLSLYEASHLAVNGEQVLDEAKEFSVRHLQPLRGQVGLNLGDQVRQSLQIPLHWRMPRLEAKHYIDAYQREEGRSLVLLELAKLDFNVVQSMHQEELKELSRWWKDLDLAKEIEFSKDRLVENYLWAAGIASEPNFSKCRKGLTKLICFLSAIDDIYDIYGSLEELKIFTTTMKSWDYKSMEYHPNEFKSFYFALIDFLEEIADDILKDHGCDFMPIQRKEWERLCGAHLVEAEWFNKDHKPFLNEYLENAWISIGGRVAMTYAYFLRGTMTRENYIQYLHEDRELIYWSTIIARLSDDLGTYKVEMERGDTAKSVQCHMNETGESEEASREYLVGLVGHSWKELNKESLKTRLPRSFVNIVLNMARTAQCIYQHGDGIGTSTGFTKNIITSLFIKPISLP